MLANYHGCNNMLSLAHLKISTPLQATLGFPAQLIKDLAYNVGDLPDPGLGRSQVGWQTIPVFLLREPLWTGGAQATVHGSRKSWTHLSD